MLVACGRSARSSSDASPGAEGGSAGCSGTACEPRGGSAGAQGGAGAAGGSGGSSEAGGSSGTGGSSTVAGEGGGGRGGSPTDSRCVVALTLDALCCFSGWPCSCAPTAMRRSELSAEACKIEYPALLAEVPENARQQCDMTPDTGCDPVTCASALYFAFENDSGECEWCRHTGVLHDENATGRAPDGTCLF